MTEDEQRIVAHAWEARLAEPEVDGEIWFVVPPEELGVVAQLYESGWLLRRLSDDGSRWRLTDRGLQTLRVDTIREAHASPN